MKTAATGVMASQPEVVIVGAGPAGVAAAIQLRRYGVDVALLEKHRVGGLLWNANLVENYPGFANGISGPRLIALFQQHLEHAGVDVIFDEVVNLDVVMGKPMVMTRSRTYEPRVVVIASGTSPRPFPVHVSRRARDHVLTSVSPLLGLRGRSIAVVGGGDAALDYALNLVHRNRVTLFNRSKNIRGLPLLWERLKPSAGFEYLGETTISGIVTTGTGRRPTLVCKSHGRRFRMPADFVVFALGRDPQLDFLSRRARQRQGELLTRGRLYYIGDVRNGPLRQTAIAVGDGIRAAMQISGAGSTR